MKTRTKIINYSMILVMLVGPIQVFCQYYPSGGYQDGGHGSGGLVSGIEELTLPIEAETLAAYPNPFHERIQIKYTLENFSSVNLDVFDVTSRRIITLVPSSRLHAGEHYVNWSGTNTHGEQIPKGIYYLRLQVDKKVLNQKIIYL